MQADVKSRARSLGIQTLGGIAWGLLFILGPIGQLILFSPVWIGVLIWRERRRAARYGLHPGLELRIGVVLLMVVIASNLPFKSEDQRVGPFTGNEVTLGELVKAEVIHKLFDASHASLRVRLPSAKPTRREVMKAIHDQTGFRATIYHCGSVASILFGGGSSMISVWDIAPRNASR